MHGTQPAACTDMPCCKGSSPALHEGSHVPDTGCGWRKLAFLPDAWQMVKGACCRAQQARQAPPAPGQQQQPSYQVSASAQRSPNAPSPQYRPAAPARYHTPVPENRGAVPAPAPRPMAPPAPRPLAPAAAVAPSSKEDDDDKATAGLSKAQKQRLRKKLREGKA